MPEETPSKVPPTLVAALAADTGAVDRTTGKKTVIGIFERIWTHRFPTQQQMTLYFRITDAKGYYPLRVEFLKLGADETRLAELRGELRATDRHAQVDFLIPTPPLLFESPGRYEFRLFANEMHVASLCISASLYPNLESQA